MNAKRLALTICVGEHGSPEKASSVFGSSYADSWEELAKAFWTQLIDFAGTLGQLYYDPATDGYGGFFSRWDENNCLDNVFLSFYEDEDDFYILPEHLGRRRIREGLYQLPASDYIAKTMKERIANDPYWIARDKIFTLLDWLEEMRAGCAGLEQSEAEAEAGIFPLECKDNSVLAISSRYGVFSESFGRHWAASDAPDSPVKLIVTDFPLTPRLTS